MSLSRRRDDTGYFILSNSLRGSEVLNIKTLPDGKRVMVVDNALFYKALHASQKKSKPK